MTAFVTNATMALVEDRGIPRSRQLDLRMLNNWDQGVLG